MKIKEFFQDRIGNPFSACGKEDAILVVIIPIVILAIIVSGVLQDIFDCLMIK